MLGVSPGIRYAGRRPYPVTRKGRSFHLLSGFDKIRSRILFAPRSVKDHIAAKILRARLIGEVNFDAILCCAPSTNAHVVDIKAATSLAGRIARRR